MKTLRAALAVLCIAVVTLSAVLIIQKVAGRVRVDLTQSRLYQGEMTFMKVAHGRHKTYGSYQQASQISYFGDGINNLHLSFLRKNLVMRIHIHNARSDGTGFVVRNLPIREDNDQVVLHCQASSSTVEANDTGILFTGNCISAEPRTIVDVDNFNSFVGKNICSFHEELVNSDASFVVKVDFGHPGSMNLTC